MIRFVLAPAALLLFMPVAQAASFDCGKAETSFEKAICDHPDLSTQDEILAKAYATAIGGLSSEAVATLKATQHSWLDYAARICSDDANPIEGDYTDDQAQCLVSTYKTRIRSLEASRMLGGYRFYPQEQYLMEQDTDADTDTDSYNKVADKHFLTVKIDGDDDTAAAFNTMTEKDRAGYADFFDANGNIVTGDTTDDIDITTTVKTVTDYRITLESDEYSYGHGAAHGNYATTYLHFLVGENRPLKAGDVFSAKGWEKTLGKLVIDKTKAQLGDGYFDDAEADIPKIAADPTRWDFSDQGLVIQFEPYEVSSYAAGAVTVTVPWDDIRDLMAESADQFIY